MRQKTITAKGIQSWQEADSALREIASLDARLEVLKKEFAEKLQSLETEADKKEGGLRNLKDALAKNLEAFVRERADELDGKTRVLDSGRLGLRRHSHIIIKDIKACIKALKKHGMEECIKVQEMVNRHILGKYDDAVLSSVKAERQIEDEFWFETNQSGGV